MSNVVHLQSRHSSKAESCAKFHDNVENILSTGGVRGGISFEDVFDFIALMTRDLRTMARQHDRTVLADLLLVASEEARAQSRAASATIVPLSP